MDNEDGAEVQVSMRLHPSEAGKRRSDAADLADEASKAQAKYLFKWIAQAGMFVYMEGGAIPGMLGQFKEKFGLDYFALGILGSVVYLSLSLGCPFFGWLYRHYNAKPVLGIALAMNNAIMLMFALCPTSLPRLFIVLRGLVGFTQASLVVYTPVWIDEFAPKGSHATWMAWLQAATPFGIMFGYMAASAFSFSGNDTIGGIYAFRYPFLIQVILVQPYITLVWAVPSAHINVVRKFRRKRDETISLWERDLKVPDGNPSPRRTPFTAAFLNPNSKFPNTRQRRNSSITEKLEFMALASAKALSITSETGSHLASNFVDEDPPLSPRYPLSGAVPPLSTEYPPQEGGGVVLRDEKGDGDEDVLADVSYYSLRPHGKNANNTTTNHLTYGYLHAVYMLMTNVTYMSIVFSLTALYFVVTGIQFWATDYLEQELGGNPTTVRLQFLFTSATAPVAGVIFGGWYVEWIGGYRGQRQRRRALGWCLLFGALACVAAAFVTMVYDTWAAASLLWVLLFFGGSVLPGGSGIFISVIPPTIRTIGSSFAAIVFNLLGYFLSPFLSGLISEQFNSLTLGFRIILGWSFFAIMFFAIAYYTSPIADDASYETLLSPRRESLGDDEREVGEGEDHEKINLKAFEEATEPLEEEQSRQEAFSPL